MIEIQVPATENSFWGKAVIFFFFFQVLYTVYLNRTLTLRLQNADPEESIQYINQVTQMILNGNTPILMQWEHQDH